MPVSGPKPKARDQIRHRVPPVHEWREYPNVPFAGGPPLPTLRGPRRPQGRPHEPTRPLGAAGRDLWDRLVPMAWDEADRARLLFLAELLDERAGLRLRVLRDSLPHERAGLRSLDGDYFAVLTAWCTAHSAPRLTVWPRETQGWWDGVRTLPHVVDWTKADWGFAVDTAHVHAAVMRGDTRQFSELRAREKVIGTTADARRDLRIRYVAAPAVEEAETPASVTTMAAYRQALNAKEPPPQRGPSSS